MADNMPQSFLVDKDMAALVGMITITWAHAENALDRAVRIVWGVAGVSPKQAALPVALKRRLRYLRWAVGSCAALDIFKDRTTEVAQVFATLANQRHDIIHGCAFWSDGSQMALYRFDTTQCVDTPKFHIVTTPLLGELYERIEALDELAVHLMKDLAETFS